MSAVGRRRPHLRRPLAAELLELDQSGDQLADRPGQVGVPRHQVAERRPFAAAEPIQERLDHPAERIVVGRHRRPAAHVQASFSHPGSADRTSLSRRKARR